MNKVSLEPLITFSTDKGKIYLTLTINRSLLRPLCGDGPSTYETHPLSQVVLTSF
jgi:hypothetical protein